MTPQNRVMLALTRDEYQVGIVERWKGGKGFMVRSDLFGFADLLAVAPYKGDAFLLQVTTVSNMASRVNKIMDECFVRAKGWLREDRRIVVVGVRKRKRKDKKNAEYSFRCIEITHGDDAEKLYAEVMSNADGVTETDNRGLSEMFRNRKVNKDMGGK